METDSFLGLTAGAGVGEILAGLVDEEPLERLFALRRLVSSLSNRLTISIANLNVRTALLRRVLDIVVGDERRENRLSGLYLLGKLCKQLGDARLRRMAYRAVVERLSLVLNFQRCSTALKHYKELVDDEEKAHLFCALGEYAEYEPQGLAERQSLVFYLCCEELDHGSKNAFVLHAILKLLNERISKDRRNKSLVPSLFGERVRPLKTNQYVPLRAEAVRFTIMWDARNALEGMGPELGPGGLSEVFYSGFRQWRANLPANAPMWPGYDTELTRLQKRQRVEERLNQVRLNWMCRLLEVPGTVARLKGNRHDHGYFAGANIRMPHTAEIVAELPDVRHDAKVTLTRLIPQIPGVPLDATTIPPVLREPRADVGESDEPPLPPGYGKDPMERIEYNTTGLPLGRGFTLNPGRGRRPETAPEGTTLVAAKANRYVPTSLAAALIPPGCAPILPNFYGRVEGIQVQRPLPLAATALSRLTARKAPEGCTIVPHPVVFPEGTEALKEPSHSTDFPASAPVMIEIYTPGKLRRIYTKVVHPDKHLAALNLDQDGQSRSLTVGCTISLKIRRRSGSKLESEWKAVNLLVESIEDETRGERQRKGANRPSGVMLQATASATDENTPCPEELLSVVAAGYSADGTPFFAPLVNIPPIPDGYTDEGTPYYCRPAALRPRPAGYTLDGEPFYSLNGTEVRAPVGFTNDGEPFFLMRGCLTCSPCGYTQQGVPFFTFAKLRRFVIQNTRLDLDRLVPLQGEEDPVLVLQDAERRNLTKKKGKAPPPSGPLPVSRGEGPAMVGGPAPTDGPRRSLAQSIIEDEESTPPTPGALEDGSLPMPRGRRPSMFHGGRTSVGDVLIEKLIENDPSNVSGLVDEAASPLLPPVPVRRVGRSGRGSIDAGQGQPPLPSVTTDEDWKNPFHAIKIGRKYSLTNGLEVVYDGENEDPNHGLPAGVWRRQTMDQSEDFGMDEFVFDEYTSVQTRSDTEGYKYTLNFEAQKVSFKSTFETSSAQLIIVHEAHVTDHAVASDREPPAKKCFLTAYPPEIFQLFEFEVEVRGTGQRPVTVEFHPRQSRLPLQTFQGRVELLDETGGRLSMCNLEAQRMPVMKVPAKRIDAGWVAPGNQRKIYIPVANISSEPYTATISFGAASEPTSAGAAQQANVSYYGEASASAAGSNDAPFRIITPEITLQPNSTGTFHISFEPVVDGKHDTKLIIRGPSFEEAEVLVIGIAGKELHVEVAGGRMGPRKARKRRSLAQISTEGESSTTAAPSAAIGEGGSILDEMLEYEELYAGATDENDRSSVLDFGIMNEQRRIRSFVLTNSSERPVQIGLIAVDKSGGWEFPKTVMLPRNGTTRIDVVFDASKSPPGKVMQQVEIVRSTSQNSVLYARAHVGAPVQFALEEYVFFQPTVVGSGAEAVVSAVLANHSDYDVQFTVSPFGDRGAEGGSEGVSSFTTSVSRDPMHPTRLPANSLLPVEFKFKPSFVGPAVAELTIDVTSPVRQRYPGRGDGQRCFLVGLGIDPGGLPAAPEDQAGGLARYGGVAFLSEWIEASKQGSIPERYERFRLEFADDLRRRAIAGGPTAPTPTTLSILPRKLVTSVSDARPLEPGKAPSVEETPPTPSEETRSVEIVNTGETEAEAYLVCSPGFDVVPKTVRVPPSGIARVTIKSSARGLLIPSTRDAVFWERNGFVAAFSEGGRNVTTMQVVGMRSALAVFPQDLLDFGTVLSTQRNEQTVLLCNNSGDEIDWTAELSPATALVFRVSRTSGRLPPMSTAQIAVSFEPDVGGDFAAQVLFRNASITGARKEGKPVSLNVKGVCAGYVEIEGIPDTMDFGRAVLGQRVQQPLQITNKGTAAAEIAVQVPRPFTLEEGETAFVLDSGQTVGLLLGYEPVHVLSDHQSILFLVNNDVISVSATGVGDEIRLVSHLGETVDFGAQEWESNRWRDVYFVNEGSVEVCVLGCISTEPERFNLSFVKDFEDSDIVGALVPTATRAGKAEETHVLTELDVDPSLLELLDVVADAGSLEGVGAFGLAGGRPCVPPKMALHVKLGVKIPARQDLHADLVAVYRPKQPEVYRMEPTRVFRLPLRVLASGYKKLEFHPMLHDFGIVPVTRGLERRGGGGGGGGAGGDDEYAGGYGVTRAQDKPKNLLELLVVNNTAEAQLLRLESISASFSIPGERWSIDTGKSLVLPVHFFPKKASVQYVGQARFVDNHGPSCVELRGIGANADLELLSAPSMDFGVIRISRSATLNIEIRNVGLLDAEFTLTLEQGGTSFWLELPSGARDLSTSGVIGSGDQISIPLVFNPTSLPAGSDNRYEGRAVLGWQDVPRAPVQNHAIPLVARVGVPNFNAACHGKPIADFDIAYLNIEKAIEVTVRNSGSASCAWKCECESSALTVSPSSGVLEAGDARSIRVVFLPRVVEQLSSRLLFDTDAGLVVLPVVSDVGTPYLHVELDQLPVDFGVVGIGTEKVQTVELVNTSPTLPVVFAVSVAEERISGILTGGHRVFECKYTENGVNGLIAPGSSGQISFIARPDDYNAECTASYVILTKIGERYTGTLRCVGGLAKVIVEAGARAGLENQPEFHSHLICDLGLVLSNVVARVPDAFVLVNKGNLGCDVEVTYADASLPQEAQYPHRPKRKNVTLAKRRTLASLMTGLHLPDAAAAEPEPEEDGEPARQSAFEVWPLRMRVEPGESVELGLSFEGFVGGTYKQGVRVCGSGLNEVLWLTATVGVPRIVANAARLYFGQVPTAREFRRSLTLTNTGSFPAQYTLAVLSRDEIKGTTRSQDEEVQFWIAGPSAGQIEQGGEAVVDVVFMCEHDAVAEKVLVVEWSPGPALVIVLRGVAGLGNLQTLFDHESDTKYGGLDFGVVALGMESTHKLILDNPGFEAIDLVVSCQAPTVTVSSAGAPVTLLPGTSLTFDVSFAPTERGMTGAVVCVDSSVGSRKIPLRGEGGLVSLRIVEASLAFEPMPLKGTQYRRVTVENTGDLACTFATEIRPPTLAGRVSCYIETGLSELMLAPMSRAVVNVKVTPLEIGEMVGQLVIVYRGYEKVHPPPPEPTLDFVLSVFPSLLEVSAYEDVDFGRVRAGGEMRVTRTIRNHGDHPTLFRTELTATTIDDEGNEVDLLLLSPEPVWTLTPEGGTIPPKESVNVSTVFRAIIPDESLRYSAVVAFTSLSGGERLTYRASARVGHPELRVSVANLSFGGDGKSAEGFVRRFSIYNTGTCDTDFSLKTMFAQAGRARSFVIESSDPSGQLIGKLAPGEERVVTIRFNPESSEKHEATIVVESTAGDAEIPMIGEAVVLRIDEGALPKVLDFGTLLVGGTATLAFDVFNDCEHAVHVGLSIESEPFASEGGESGLVLDCAEYDIPANVPGEPRSRATVGLTMRAGLELLRRMVSAGAAGFSAGRVVRGEPTERFLFVDYGPKIVSIPVVVAVDVRRLVVEPPQLDFGEFVIGIGHQRTFTLHNPSTIPVKYRLTTEAQHLWIDGGPGTVGPGETVEVSAGFKPTTETRILEAPGPIVLREFDGAVDDVVIPVLGVAERSTFVIDTADIDFGEAFSASPVVRELKLPNGTLDDVPYSIVLESAFPEHALGWFSVAKEDRAGIIPKEASATVRLFFQPGVDAESVCTCVLVLHTTSRSFSINLRATALMPSLQVSPLRLDFGAIAVGRSISRPLTLRNTGNRPVAIALAGRLPLGFNLTLPVEELAPGEDKVLSVDFTGPDHSVDCTGEVRFMMRRSPSSVDATPEEMSRPLAACVVSGKGLAISLTIDPVFLDVGECPRNYIGAGFFTAENTGEEPLAITVLDGRLEKVSDNGQQDEELVWRVYPTTTSIGAGERFTFELAFQPRGLGRFTQALVFHVEQLDGASVRFPARLIVTTPADLEQPPKSLSSNRAALRHIRSLLGEPIPLEVDLAAIDGEDESDFEYEEESEEEVDAATAAQIAASQHALRMKSPDGTPLPGADEAEDVDAVAPLRGESAASLDRAGASTSSLVDVTGGTPSPELGRRGSVSRRGSLLGKDGEGRVRRKSIKPKLAAQVPSLDAIKAFNRNDPSVITRSVELDGYAPDGDGIWLILQHVVRVDATPDLFRARTIPPVEPSVEYKDLHDVVVRPPPVPVAELEGKRPFYAAKKVLALQPTDWMGSA